MLRSCLLSKGTPAWNFCYLVHTSVVWDRFAPKETPRGLRMVRKAVRGHNINLSAALSHMTSDLLEAIGWSLLDAKSYTTIDQESCICLELHQPTVRSWVSEDLFPVPGDLQDLLSNMGVLTHSSVEEFLMQADAWVRREDQNGYFFQHDSRRGFRMPYAFR